MTFIVYAFIGLPLLAILIFNLAGKSLGAKFCIQTGYVVSVAQIAAAIVMLGLLFRYNKDAIIFSQFWDYAVIDGAAYFAPDVISFIMLLTVGLVTLISFLTARDTIEGERFHYANMMMVLLLGMNGIAMVSDLFSLYVFMEVTGVACFILISLFRDDKGLEGAFKYLVMSCIATAFILLGLSIFFMNAGTLQYDAVSSMLSTWETNENRTMLVIAFILLISGFSIKAGLAPFHGWLPDAHGSAPSPVSVVLSGVVIKMTGVYTIIRLLEDFLTEPSVVGTAFMLLGLFSIILGSLSAIGQNDFKRILAYSSVSHIGYIVLGLSCGSALGLVGAMMHIFNHATFKSTLFANAAAVKHQTGTTDITKLGGLHKQMPVTGASSVIAFLSAAGIPPFAGFWSKLLIIIAVWQSAGGLVAGLAAFAGIFTAAYFLRLQRSVFFGPAEEHLAQVKEAGPSLRFAEILLTVISTGCGLIFPFLLRFMQTQGWL